jgi:hypothetical protein
MRIFYFLIFLLFSALSSFSQPLRSNSKTGENIDVDNYQIWWRINPDSAKGIKGVVKIKFKTTVANVTKISFDLSSLLTVSQVTFRGTNLSLASLGKTGDSLVIPLGTTIATIGTRDSVTISYSGLPQNGNSGTGGGRLGYTKDVDPSVTATESAGSGPKRGFPVSAGSGNYVWTLAESYEDRDWWPCKADMMDKADTIDISVNVPWLSTGTTDTFWVATNGTLIDSTINSTDKSRTFTFINRYPITTYLVSVCVARFNRYYRGTIPIGGFNVPVVYYLFPGKSNYAPILAAMDKATELVTAFGTKYGDYGFIDKAKGGKHGFYEGLGAFGGEEHQTFSGISSNSLTSTSLLAHELAHQWFGDKVSFSTFNDLWLAEGFAEYSPAYAAELVSGMGYTALSQRQSFQTNAISETVSAYIPNASIVSSDKIWGNTTGSGYQNTVYYRGAMVVSMLRTLAGEIKFVEAVKDYQLSATTQYKSATTDTLISKFNKALGAGIDLTQFFTDNVKGTGYPSNTIKYAQRFGAYDSVYFKVTGQTRINAGAATYIQQPVSIHIKKTTAPAKDTTIVFYDWGAGKVSKAGNGLSSVLSDSVGYRLSFKAESYLIDDSVRTMSSGNTISGFSRLGTGVLDLRIIDFTAKAHDGYNDAVLTLDDNSINTPVMLERSANGLDFKEIGKMNLQVNAGTAKKYVLNDLEPLKSTNFYRATFKDINGTNVYSKVIKIDGLKSVGFNLISNPVSDVIQIKTDEEHLNKPASFSIYDASSKMIFNKEFSHALSITDIPVTNIASGVYVVKITISSGETQNIKFIKK